MDSTGTMYNVHCTVFSVQCTMYSIQCKLVLLHMLHTLY